MQKLKETQKRKIKGMLSKKYFTCTTPMAAQFIPDYRRRLCDLKENGVKMGWRWCETHEHAGHPKEWRLL